MNEAESEILDLTRKLITSIVNVDWESYVELCADDLTSYEPEADQHLVQGMGFHKHYFDMAGGSPYTGVTTTISNPHVRILSDDAAVITYVRLTQRVGDDGKSSTSATVETRVWQRIDGRWKHVHFHRS